jgi:hypothetical protein
MSGTPDSSTVIEPEAAPELASARPLALLVLGMHRSGTSVLTRVLSLMGADLPSRLLAANQENETGYWESEELSQLQEELLQSAHLAWDHSAAFPQAWYETRLAGNFRHRAMEILRRDFGGSRMFVLKDPRMSLLVPFWTALLQEFGADPVFIISVRDPLEVAGSLGKRNQFSAQKSMLLWLRYMLDAQRATEGLRRCHVAYHDLLTDWRAVVGFIARKTGIVWPRAASEAAAEIESLISSNLRHQRAAFGAIASDPSVNWRVKQAYAVALAAAGGDESALREINDRINASLEAAIAMFDPLIAERQAAACDAWYPHAEMIPEEHDAVAAAPPQSPPASSAAGVAGDNVESGGVHSAIAEPIVTAQEAEMEAEPVPPAADPVEELDRDAIWLFNADYYLDTNPDVAASGIDPLTHFLYHGWKEHRSPHPFFDLPFYLEVYPDVVAAAVNPLLHFLQSGCAEGRNPNRFFDIEYYARNNPDVVAVGVNLVRHFVYFGGREGRDPGPMFDCKTYLDFNPEYRELGVDPLSHYLWRGVDEGLSPLPLSSLRLQRRPARKFDR